MTGVQVPSDDPDLHAAPDPATDEAVDDPDRERAAWRIRAALDEGDLELEEAGQRLSAVFRARTRVRLEQLIADLDQPGAPVDDGLDRATLLRAGLRILLFAVLTALLLTALLHGIGPVDRY